MSFTTRPELSGTFGMVTSTHWLATAAGMKMLEAGGSDLLRRFFPGVPLTRDLAENEALLLRLLPRWILAQQVKPWEMENQKV